MPWKYPVIVEHAVDGVQELALDGQHGLARLFPPSEDRLVEGGDMGLVPDGEGSREVEGASHVPVADLTDAFVR